MTAKTFRERPKRQPARIATAQPHQQTYFGIPQDRLKAKRTARHCGEHYPRASEAAVALCGLLAALLRTARCELRARTELRKSPPHDAPTDDNKQAPWISDLACWAAAP